jgi:hypothetical protein
MRKPPGHRGGRPQGTPGPRVAGLKPEAPGPTSSCQWQLPLGRAHWQLEPVARATTSGVGPGTASQYGRTKPRAAGSRLPASEPGSESACARPASAAAQSSRSLPGRAPSTPSRIFRLSHWQGPSPSRLCGSAASRSFQPAIVSGGLPVSGSCPGLECRIAPSLNSTAMSVMETVAHI